ncbi:centromere protein C-like [Heterodontus francisci]|uniref:centromere protein C-like n=1 Tax=Heterodontus francisci TaxID=7792 RepID=UPI00355BFE61
MEEESFSFESQIIIPRKTPILSQKADKQEKKSVANIREVKMKGKDQKTARKEVPATELLPFPKELEGKGTSKLNKPTKQEAGKMSAVLPLKNHVDPSSTSNLPLMLKQKTKLGHKKQKKSGKECAAIENNRDEREACEEEPPLHIAVKVNEVEKSKVSEQGAVISQNAAKSDRSVNLSKAVVSNSKTPKRILCSGPGTSNKKKAVNHPMSSGYYSLTKSVDLVSLPLTKTIADDQEYGKLTGLEMNKSRASLFNGKNKEATIVNASQTLSRLPQSINSKGPPLNASKVPAVLKSLCVNNKQKECPTENAIPSTSGIEKRKKERAPRFPNNFGIKPANSALPQPKPVTHITSAPNREFEFELEEEESFCFESWITIPKKAINQDPTQQEKKSVLDEKKTKKKESVQKTEATRKVTIQSKKNNDEKRLALNKNKRAKNENQPKGSGRKSPCPLKNNKTVVSTEQEEQEIQNESLSHSERLLSPKQIKLKPKRQRTGKKPLSESDRAEEKEQLQEDFCVEDNENRTDKSQLLEQDITFSGKLSKSGSSLNLPRLHNDGKKSKLTLFAKPQTQKKKRTKKGLKQNPKVKKKEMSVKETRTKKPGYSKKCLPSYELDENLLRDNAVNVYTRSRRLTRPPPRWWVVQHDGNHLPKRLNTDYLPELPLKSRRKKMMVLKMRPVRAQTKPLETEVCSSEEQNFEEDVSENDCSPGSPPHSQSKLTGQRGTANQKGNCSGRPPNHQPKPTEQRGTANQKGNRSGRPPNHQSKPTGQRRTANQKGSHSGNVSVKKKSRKQKYSSPSIPKKRLFSEAEEEKANSDVHLPKKQKSTLELKVYDFDTYDKNEVEEEEEYSPLSRSAHVYTSSKQIKDYISSSFKPTSQKPFREPLASFAATYVDKKTPQRPAAGPSAIVEVSSRTPNQVVMRPRKSFTKPANELRASTQVSSGTPNRVVMSPRNYDTVQYRDKTDPSQHCEQTSVMSEEDDQPEPSTSVQSKRTLKQGLPYGALPVFNKSGPGPCANYEEESFDAGDNGNLDHGEMMDFSDANEDDSSTKESASEENDNCEKEPSEVAIQECLKPTCVWSVKESSEVFVDCVKTSEMCNFFYPLKTEYEDNRSIAICKSLNWKTFSCGKLVLGPYKEKGCQMVYKDTMVFHILKGELGITIYRTTYHLKEGDYFFVPSGNTYNVTNLLDTEAVLLFTQLKGAKMD